MHRCPWLPPLPSQVDPGQMSALAGPGVEEYGGAAGGATASVRAPVGAAAIVTAIHSQPGRDAIHPAQAALGIAIRLDAAGGLAVERARRRTARAVQAM